MKNPLISVVVPAYKVEEYIEKCLDSILNQTYKNLEIILVDDGSPDNCPKICDEYAKKDDRIKVIHKQNGGLSDARNRGIKEATGEYIAFVDSDDYLESEMYEYLYNLLIKYNADISICGYRTFDENSSMNVATKEETCFNTIEALKALSEDIEVKNFAWNKLYKRSLFVDNNIEFPKGKIMEDIATTYKLFEKSKIIVAGEKCYYNYLIRTSGIIGSRSTRLFVSHIEHVLDRYEHFKEDKELGFYFYKSVFYVLMRMYIEANAETIKYIEDNNILVNIIEEGKQRGYYKDLSLADKARLLLLKMNKKLYRKIMLFRRRIING